MDIPSHLPVLVISTSSDNFNELPEEIQDLFSLEHHEVTIISLLKMSERFLNCSYLYYFQNLRHQGFFCSYIGFNHSIFDERRLYTVDCIYL